MHFTRSKLMMMCLLSTSIFTVTACSSSDNAQKKDDTLTATAPATGQASNITERNVQQRLRTTLEKNFKLANVTVKINDIKATDVPNLYWVSLEGMSPIYTTGDGQFLIQGDILRLGDKQLHNVGEAFQAEINKKHFDALKKEDLIVYPAKGKTKHVVYVFTDASCPYCHKLHEHMDEINAKGIEVRYIAWPRGDQFIPTMEAIWCSKDRKAAFNQAITDQPINSTQCKNPVRDQFQLGQTIGVNGTPAIYSANGVYLGGYLTASEIESRLNN